MRAVSVLGYGLNPDWKSSQISFLSKKEYNCEDATCSSIFDRKGRLEICLQLTRSLGSSCVFFNERLNNSQCKGFGDIP